jgi:hypothetical protein
MFDHMVMLPRINSASKRILIDFKFFARLKESRRRRLRRRLIMESEDTILTSLISSAIRSEKKAAHQVLRDIWALPWKFTVD